MNGSNNQTSTRALRVFEPAQDVVYSLDATARIVDVPRRTILVYYRHGLVAPASDPAREGYYFSGEAIRELCRIELLRRRCGINLTGARIILQLTREVERLRHEVEGLQA